MGSRISRSIRRRQVDQVLVVYMDGRLKRFRVPTLAKNVVASESNKVSQNGYCCNESFVCSSDCMHIGEPIESVGWEEKLDPGQLYFVLPKKKLSYALSFSDTAHLLRIANSAISRSHGRFRLKKWKLNFVEKTVLSGVGSWVGHFSSSPSPTSPFSVGGSPFCRSDKHYKLETIQEV